MSKINVKNQCQKSKIKIKINNYVKKNVKKNEVRIYNFFASSQKTSISGNVISDKFFPNLSALLSKY